MENEWTEKIARLEAENERLEKENKPLSDFRRITKTYKGRGINQTDNMVIIDRQSYEEKEQQRMQLRAVVEKAEAYTNAIDDFLKYHGDVRRLFSAILVIDKTRREYKQALAERKEKK